MKRILLRALGIWTLKAMCSVAFIYISVMFFLGAVSAPLLGAAFYIAAFILAFLFGDWLFANARPNLRQFAIIAVVTYLWEFVFEWAVFTFAMGPYRYGASFGQWMLYFVIHVAALYAAKYVRAHFSNGGGITEGLIT